MPLKDICQTRAPCRHGRHPAPSLPISQSHRCTFGRSLRILQFAISRFTGRDTLSRVAPRPCPESGLGPRGTPLCNLAPSGPSIESPWRIPLRALRIPHILMRHRRTRRGPTAHNRPRDRMASPSSPVRTPSRARTPSLHHPVMRRNRVPMVSHKVRTAPRPDPTRSLPADRTPTGSHRAFPQATHPVPRLAPTTPHRNRASPALS